MKYQFNLRLYNNGRALLCVCFALFIKSSASQAQPMPAGFDAREYADLLHLNFVAMSDTAGSNALYNMNSGKYTKLLRSPEVGLYNRCEVLVRTQNATGSEGAAGNDKTAIISLRGTIGKKQSWMENFYAAMVPANGSLDLNDSTHFEYKLSSGDQAMVHVGWLVGLAYLSPYINAQLETLLAGGVNKVIVMGHSQGGALAFLTTSYIWYKYHEKYPAMQLKTYASAAPKPGNLYYAYDFEHITRDGFGFRIVNAADWVPESPLSVQTVSDFNEVSPIRDARKILKKQKFLLRTVLMHVYNQMDNASYKTMKRYRKYLGGLMYKRAKSSLVGFKEPVYSYASNYMTAGTPVILMADDDYRSKFKFDGKDYFVHHQMKPYLYLLSKQYPPH